MYYTYAVLVFTSYCWVCAEAIVSLATTDTSDFVANVQFEGVLTQ